MRSKIITILLLSMLLLSVTMVAVPVFASPDPIWKIYPQPAPLELGDETLKTDVVCTYFDVAVVVEDIVAPGIYGLDLQLGWDTTWIEYVDHTTTIPVETYNTPQAPSPHAGILHEGVTPYKDVADETMTDPRLSGSAAGTMMWLSYVSNYPAANFTGDGTVVVITFHVKDQPFDSEMPMGDTFYIEFKQTALSDADALPVTHGSEDYEIHLWPREFEYAPVPKLSVLPEEIEGTGLGDPFSVDVVISDELHDDLSGFWDVAGFDFYVNFDPTLIEATAVVIDPDTVFGDDWPTSFYEFLFKLIDIPEGGPREGYEINNVEGWVHIAFMGIGEHTPPTGIFRLAEITFNSIYESDTYPPPCSPIWLENPLPDDWSILHSLDGIITLTGTGPEDTWWEQLIPSPYLNEYELESWTDDNPDGKLGPSDQIILRNNATDKTADYHVEELFGTLALTQEPFPATDDYVWASDAVTDYGMFDYCGHPGRLTAPAAAAGPPDAPFDGFGKPNWTGNFTTVYPFVNVVTVTANFVGNGTSRVLVENVDYKVHTGDQLIELLVPIDVEIINEVWVDGDNNTLNGWPLIGYTATNIENVHVYFPNATDRDARNDGFEEGPPSEWWFEPDYPCELEGWWALGYVGGPETWPENTTWAINYTAISYLTIDYNAPPDPRPYYVEFEGTYEDFLALGDPITTQWHEIYPYFSRVDNLTDWIDSDLSGDISYCDFIKLVNVDTLLTRWYHVEAVSTDMKVVKKPCIQDKDPLMEFYTWPRTVDIAGYPHPERAYSPWFNSDTSVPIPHVVNPAEYCAPFKLLGRNIDLYVSNYPEGFKGRGPGVPADAFPPQKIIILHADVTYNLWPVQSKDVSFEIVSPHGDYVIVRCGRTDENGTATIEIGLPWPCDDPESLIYGTWTVTATVDIMCTVVNDTLTFEVGCLIGITDIVPSKPDYEIGEHMSFNITYTSISHQLRDALFYITVYDDLGVPIGYMYTWVLDIEYGDGWIVLDCLEVPKNTFVGMGTVYANALTDWPENMGIQYCHEVSLNIGLLIPS